MPKVVEENGYLKFQDANERVLIVPANKGWTLTGTPDAPTLQPSVKQTHPAYPEQGISAYVDHHIITDGKVHYCSDSTHEWAGQTVDLVEVTP